MAEVGGSKSKSGGSRRAPAKTPEEREHQLIDAAMDLAEKQIKNNTASAQVITHFLKLGTARDLLERERMRAEVELTKGKLVALANMDDIKVLHEKAMEAMTIYRPPTQEERGDDVDD